MTLETKTFCNAATEKYYLPSLGGLRGTELALLLPTQQPRVPIKAQPLIFIISITQFVNSRDQKSNPSSGRAKDFANAVQQRPEQKVLLKHLLYLLSLQVLGYKRKPLQGWMTAQLSCHVRPSSFITQHPGSNLGILLLKFLARCS